MNIQDNQTVAEIVTENYKTADIFKKKGIDFCCGGKVTLKDICAKKNIPYNELKTELEKVDQKNDQPDDFNNWSLDRLADHIINVHHQYVRENIPILSQYANKVARVHGDANPEVVEINYLFQLIAEDLERHMIKEENILFPYIKNLAQVEAEKIPFALPHFGTVQNPINMMEHEHDVVGEYGHKIAELSNQYTPPAHACNTYRVLFAKLKEFEEDLHLHIHLENNILFKKAIELEAKFTKAS